MSSSSTNSDPCLVNYLTIETANRHLSPVAFDYAYYDDDDDDNDLSPSYDYPLERPTSSNQSTPAHRGSFRTNHSPTNNNNNNMNNKKRKFQINSKSSEYPNQKQTIVKLCDKANFNSTQTKFFLIKTAATASTPTSGGKTPRSDLVISYFNLFATLSETARLNDFRISYEFVNFDWHAYQEASLCNFIYDASLLEHSSGLLTNPKSRIFYTNSGWANPNSDDNNDAGYLTCKYRLMAKQNQVCCFCLPLNSKAQKIHKK